VRLSILSLVFISFSAWGISTPLFRHQLMSRTAVGAQKKWEFARTPKGYRLNGLVLSSERVIRQGESLKVLQETQPAKTSACPAGTYTFRTNRPNSKEVVERGCLGTVRFGQLRDVFEQLARR
jgi:hypothetical protein